ncbi:C39 family peptidase, partial [Leptospira idonii]
RLNPEGRAEYDRLTEELKAAELAESVGKTKGIFELKSWEEAQKKLEEVKLALKDFVISKAKAFGISVGKEPVKPLNAQSISNSSVDIQQRFIDAVENPNVNSYKTGGNLKLEFPEGTPPEKIKETLEKVGKQMVKDAFFDYDSSAHASEALEKFAAANGLNSPNATPEQKQIYAAIKSDLNAAVVYAKADFNTARIEYVRENYARLTTEKLVAEFGDRIDTQRSTDQVTVLKNGEGVILNQVYYDSQNDNKTNIQFKDYNLRPGNECSPTSTSIVSEYMGAKPQNGQNQQVDDFIKQAQKDGILVKGDELKKNIYLEKVLSQYEQKLVDLEPDLIPRPGTNPVKYETSAWKTESIKAALNEGKPVVVGGKFDVAPVTEGHRLVIVGYDSTGWIVHDPFGNANVTGYKGSGMYAHYDYGKWGIGSKDGTAFVIENLPKKEE